MVIAEMKRVAEFAWSAGLEGEVEGNGPSQRKVAREQAAGPGRRTRLRSLPRRCRPAPKSGRGQATARRCSTRRQRSSSNSCRKRAVRGCDQRQSSTWGAAGRARGSRWRDRTARGRMSTWPSRHKWLRAGLARAKTGRAGGPVAGNAGDADAVFLHGGQVGNEDIALHVCTSGQMADHRTRPAFAEVVGQQAAMAAVGLVFAAEQAEAAGGPAGALLAGDEVRGAEVMFVAARVAEPG